MATADFPTKVWKGQTPSRGALATKPHQYPTAEDYDQLTAEIVAMQDFLRTLKFDNLDCSGFKTVEFDGHNGAGACTATGSTIGQRVVKVIGHVKANTGAHSFIDDTAKFEASITVADQIQQSSATDVSANTYIAILAPLKISITA